MGTTAIAYALQLLGSLPGLIQAGADVFGIITTGREKIDLFDRENRDPTPEEWDELNQKIEALRAELHDRPVPAAKAAKKTGSGVKRG